MSEQEREKLQQWLEEYRTIDIEQFTTDLQREQYYEKIRFMENKLNE